MNNTIPPIIAELDAMGVRFTRCTWHGKQPVDKGWQRRGKGKRAAAEHLAVGKNIGALCGTGHNEKVYVVDLDKLAAERMAEIPQLAATRKILRDNAPDRAKFMFKTAGYLPASRKDHDAGIEILGEKSNAVVLGTHASGAPIYVTDEPILELSAAECDAIWARCGARNVTTATEAASLDSTSTSAVDLLNAAIIAGVPGRRNTTGFELAQRLRDAGYSTIAARAVMLDYQVAVQHTGNHEYTEREALASLHSAYRRKPKAKARSSSRKPVHDVLDDLKRRVVSGDINLPANMERTFLAALDTMHAAQSLDDVHMPTGEISDRASMPRPTVWRHMRTLVEMKLLKLVARGNWTEATVYSLGDVALDRMKHSLEHPANMPPRGVSFCPSDELLLAYQSLDRLPLTETGARIDVRLAANEEQTTWSFGASAYRLLAHLMVSPAEDVDDLAKRARVSVKTARRKLASLIAAGIVVDADELRLADDWQQRINDIAPALVTFGRREIRAVHYARQRIAIHEHMLALYDSRPLRRRAELADLAEDALRQARTDLEHWTPFVRETNLQRIEWAREHLDMSPDAVPPCSLNANMVRPNRVRQPVMARGRKLIPNGDLSAREQAACNHAWGGVSA